MNYALVDQGLKIKNAAMLNDDKREYGHYWLRFPGCVWTIGRWDTFHKVWEVTYMPSPVDSKELADIDENKIIRANDNT